jgi:hypothetical protein
MRCRGRVTQHSKVLLEAGSLHAVPVFPLIFHDIDAEIPPDSQQIMHHLYWLWLVLAGTLVVNVSRAVRAAASLRSMLSPLQVVACVFLITRGSDGIKDIITSCVYLPVISVLSFLLWYR